MFQEMRLMMAFILPKVRSTSSSSLPYANSASSPTNAAASPRVLANSNYHALLRAS